MRALWVSLCCALTAVSIAQAEPYRSQDRDGGFNPMGMMNEMPAPMSMFDSSDRRRHELRRRRPPLYRPPISGYPGAPYTYPSAGPAPYGNYQSHPSQTIYSGAARQERHAPNQTVQNPRAPSVEAVAQPQTPPDHRTQPVMPDDGEQLTGYSFRPMTPMSQKTGKAAPPFVSTEKSPASYTEQPHATAPSAPLPATNPKASSDSREPAMINGKPAVFRPMDLGAETPTE